jgi:sterol desaturase/sphingolipid hydroxylase (fatty acid hydroxylase superfamily)
MSLTKLLGIILLIWIVQGIVVGIIMCIANPYQSTGHNFAVAFFWPFRILGEILD